ncbi:MAG: DUF2865 domain-containing protein [Mesorhizobium sp.]|uniref:DUF2865 domain-containing protein n=2 Tax=Mesorhizobium sp. TaxID=1871066 RepID=UPI000FE43E01|nr:DUF2865 domain-containing protein [Mesorhizobium sp.]RWH75668.1 MAG: DUF2865 domain-containing protein [Mesorhizobium sp.]RWL31904.1 MAG: DUF2865 domain-containing protein [Mesorhizobium sp.]RWL33273.1 MAG: DUF2865 domain-containing protein [Mesorhizobium sp.]RWL39516.1 MAG: DUF2865 domain-containing protein [Mesorhizobium sp.]RWL52687.1 MAG: DUF2865 domain-containing protein [Mesorhizobium sp.]
MKGARSKLALLVPLPLLAALAGAVAVTDSQADSRTCRQLEADLAATRGGGGGPGLVRKYDDAIARQREQLARARGRASDAGCGFTLFSRNVSRCAAINASIERMNANLDALQAKRERLAAGSTRRDRGRILAALDANNCRDDEIAPRRAPLQEASRDNGGGNLFEQLFGRQGEQLETPDAPDMPDASDVPLDDPSVRNIRRVINQPDGMDLPRLGGEFHTMCVRTCDGYFYPMSNAASVGDFERDQKNCESSCPGTEMQVFYSRGMDDDSGSMTSSVTGQPYSELPTAYLYKQANYSRPPSCGCNAQAGNGNFTIIGGNPPANPEQSQSEGGAAPFIPAPANKPDPGADPETLANAEGGLDLDAIKRLTTKVPVSPVSALPPDQRKVRVVGPAFLPDPSAAIDLKAPAPKSAR